MRRNEIEIIAAAVIVSIVLAAALGVAVLWPVTARSESAPAYVRAACTADAIRLCGQFVFDATEERVGACMKAHRNQLSRGCLAAIRQWKPQEK